MSSGDFEDFEVLSCQPIFRMILTLQVSDQIKKIPVSLDYQNQKAYFEDNFSLNLDYQLLEKKIFEKLNLNLSSPPVLDNDVLIRINEMRDGKYGQEKFQI